MGGAVGSLAGPRFAGVGAAMSTGTIAIIRDKYCNQHAIILAKINFAQGVYFRLLTFVILFDL